MSLVQIVMKFRRIATTLAPEDPEIAFNFAAVLEACKHLSLLLSGCGAYCSVLAKGGRLEEALTHYKRSKAHGVDRAEAHIQNVSLLNHLMYHLYTGINASSLAPRSNARKRKVQRKGLSLNDCGAD
jgi:hypothetical protein